MDPVAKRKKQLAQNSPGRQQFVASDVAVAHVGVVLFQPVIGSIRYSVMRSWSQQRASGDEIAATLVQLGGCSLSFAAGETGEAIEEETKRAKTTC